MRALIKKLRFAKGETLVETLTAVLIISLASVALASMIAAASRLNIRARENDERLYAAISELESGAGESEAGTVTVTMGEQSRKVDFSVSYVNGGEGLLSAFEYSGGGA